LTQATYQ